MDGNLRVYLPGYSHFQYSDRNWSSQLWFNCTSLVSERWSGGDRGENIPFCCEFQAQNWVWINSHSAVLNCTSLIFNFTSSPAKRKSGCFMGLTPLYCEFEFGNDNGLIDCNSIVLNSILHVFDCTSPLAERKKGEFWESPIANFELRTGSINCN